MTDWAFEQQAGSLPNKAVLMALAIRHNDETGKCCPSVSKLAEDVEGCNATVRKALKALCAQGLIARKRRRRENGSLGVYDYTFPLAETSRASQPPLGDSAGNRYELALGPPLRASAQEPGSTTTFEPGRGTILALAAANAASRVAVEPIDDETLEALEYLVEAVYEHPRRSFDARTPTSLVERAVECGLSACALGCLTDEVLDDAAGERKGNPIDDATRWVMGVMVNIDAGYTNVARWCDDEDEAA